MEKEKKNLTCVFEKNRVLVKNLKFSKLRKIKDMHEALKCTRTIIETMIKEFNEKNDETNHPKEKIIDYILIRKHENAYKFVYCGIDDFYIKLSKDIIGLSSFQEKNLNNCCYSNSEYRYVTHKLPLDVFPRLVTVILKLTKQLRFYDEFLKEMDKNIRQEIMHVKSPLTDEDEENITNVLNLLQEKGESYIQLISQELALSPRKIRTYLDLLITADLVKFSKKIKRAKCYAIKNLS